ncbi:hypothetical protein C8J56DRAFT_750705, partial [Mycena floridula]
LSMFSAMFSRFPNEIYDTIIDDVKDDPEVLPSGSLVCRAWLPRCRHHLFSLLSI